MVVDERALSTVLSEMARTLASDPPVQSVLDALVARVVDVLPVSAAGIAMIADASQRHRVAASDETALKIEQLQLQLKEGPCLAAFGSGQPVLIPDLERDGRFPHFAPAALEVGLHAVFTFPLRHGLTRLGALDLYGHSPTLLDPRDIVVAQDLADVAAAFVLNAQARNDAQAALDLFQHDPLTGLPNRIMLQQRLEHAAERACRHRTNAALVFANIDHFADINKTRGHRAGDQILTAVAERLATVVGPRDFLARVAADEFALLCEGIEHITDVETVAKRIDELFASPYIVHGRPIMISARIEAINAIGTDYAKGYFYARP
jgi:diguanylate cyclase (GGDEF)-like protein